MFHVKTKLSTTTNETAPKHNDKTNYEIKPLRNICIRVTA